MDDKIDQLVAFVKEEGLDAKIIYPEGLIEVSLDGTILGFGGPVKAIQIIGEWCGKEAEAKAKMIVKLPNRAPRAPSPQAALAGAVLASSLYRWNV